MKKLNKKGFTIVELVIVIAVIGVLAGVLIPTFGGVIASANASAALQTARGCLSTALNMSSTGALPGKTDKGAYRTAFFVDQTGDGKVDYAFGYNGNELITEDLKDISNKLDCNTLLLSSEFVSDSTTILTTELGSGSPAMHTKSVSEHWYTFDELGKKIDPDGAFQTVNSQDKFLPEHTGKLDLLCANMFESIYNPDMNVKNSEESRFDNPGMITQDWSNGIKYIYDTSELDTSTTDIDDDTRPISPVTKESYNIFVNNDLSKKVVILTYFG